MQSYVLFFSFFFSRVEALLQNYQCGLIYNLIHYIDHELNIFIFVDQNYIILKKLELKFNFD
jgi:hypothetical protein